MISMFKKKAKRGQVLGLMVFGLAIVFVSIGFIFLTFFISEMNDIIQSTDEFGDASKDYMSNVNSTLPGTLDASFALMIVLASLILVASVLFIDTSPLFIAISLPIFVIVLLANAIFANLIDEFGNTAALASAYANFPMMQFFALHWVAVMTVVGFLSIIAFFGGKGLK